MEKLFITIRHMTSDSRMIHLNTGEPQYKIDQLKRKLFLAENEQPREVCEWWFRLYHGERNKEDIRQLRRQLEKV